MEKQLIQIITCILKFLGDKTKGSCKTEKSACKKLKKFVERRKSDAYLDVLVHFSLMFEQKNFLFYSDSLYIIFLTEKKHYKKLIKSKNR